MIKLSRPILQKEEESGVINVLRSGHIAAGEITREFESLFAKYTTTKYAIATSSGTSALHAALLSLNIGHGDAVLTTPFSFIATANSVLFCGARPLFCDIDSMTFNISCEGIEKALKKNKKIKALLIVHLYGQPCDMDNITRLVKRHGIYLVEDCAQAQGAQYKGKKVGSFGDASIFSFYATKNMTTAEGGMIVTQNKNLERASRSIINHGRMARYMHSRLGFNFRLTDIASSVGICQLQKLDRLNAARIKNAAFLSENISSPYIETPFVDDDAVHVFHQYTLKVKKNRNGLKEYLKKNGVESEVIYPMLIPGQPFYKKLGYSDANLKEGRRACKEVLSIPVHPALTNNNLKKISNLLTDWKPR